MLRSLLAGDGIALKHEHERAVTVTCATHYTPAQIAVWTAGTPAGFEKIMGTSPFSRVYEADGQVVGFVTVRPNNKTIWHLYVLPDYKGKGVGRALLQAAEDYLYEQGCKEVELESTLNARRFYEYCGYQCRGERELAFAGVMIPASVMHKTFNNPLESLDNKKV